MKKALFFILLTFCLQADSSYFEFVDSKSEGSLSRQLMEKLVATFSPDLFFETGTYDGGTTLNAANYFNEVFTVEIYEPLFKKVQPKFHSHSNIHSLFGNSSEAILQSKLEGAILFWLDAHYSGEGTGLLESANSGSAESITPIREELAAIRKAGISDCVILIDDIRGFGTEINDQIFLGCWAYPTLQEVKTALLAINPRFELALLGDTLLAYDGSKYHPTFSDTVKACTKTRLYDGSNLSDEELLDLERQIQRAPPHEAEFIAKLYDMMSPYSDPMFWHDLWYGLIQLKAEDFVLAGKAFQGAIPRIESGTFRTVGENQAAYRHKSLSQYIEQCHLEGSQNDIKIDQVVIWGHKLHSHTHSYIHYGFYKAFNYLGYKTLWLDNSDDCSSIDFSNSLFITEHQVDQRMPLRDDCYYFVHYPSDQKYEHLKEIKHFVDLGVYKNCNRTSPTLREIEPYVFYDFENMYLLIPWATDLLPDEIERNKPLSPLHRLNTRGKIVYWVGSIGGGREGNYPELSPFIQACKDRGIQFIQSDPWSAPVDAEKNIAMIQSSYLAPAICGAIQLEHDYIPCRIFKNISYGHLGLTNSKAVNDLFGGRLVYDPDTYQLFLKGEAKLKERNIQEQYELMDFIKEHHTYLNRARHLLNFLEKSREYWGH